ncbi:MAG: hypothetical protein HFP81_00965 [Methylococcales symbiont of Hymedesmia sp. n. MRB-2018]|nr:MAG: hypothetical protein HFP78_01650 [Methylococcales symbiont of Hymedesmia sp. n. MRB-2018]KAF3984660.1 MAG: hypothetical protein HFP81_00965 [Methylococcales symbiont of Hymedesmia sp. n. MRB-2018]
MVKTNKNNKRRPTGVGYFINGIQTLFVGMLRIWTIPIVLMLSVASGFTTFYGLSHFITDWIALIITIAIQSIIVICSLEIAGIHWKANRVRYASVVLSLLIALTASVSFSYFKFYEISQQGNIHINRLDEIRQSVKTYLGEILTIKGEVIKQQHLELKKASDEAAQAYFGTHPLITGGYRNQIGDGPFYKHYKQMYEDKKIKQQNLDLAFSSFDKKIQQLQVSLSNLDVAKDLESSYYDVLTKYQDVQIQTGQLSSSMGQGLPEAPLLMTYRQFTVDVTPSIVMWKGFSLFAFICAAMVDFFTVLLSYRLEFTAPGPLTIDEEELVFECLRQFTEFTINNNDELQMVIEKTDIEKARKYSDLSRMFAVGLLLNRGFLRKLDHRTVEFAPNLYPLIAEKMGDKINQIRTASLTNKDSISSET